MSLKPPTQDELVISASGKTVRKGEVPVDRAPEIRFEELEWGEKIGTGCFGNVYKGKCRGINVAIKQLLKQELDAKALEDFRKEVDIMAQMRHPNVCLFMGACLEKGKMAIVTELLRDNVQNLLKVHGKEVTLLQRVKIAKDCAKGMAWLHGANPQIIHRDLKPSNLLIDEHWNVKVCDFGLSQVKLRNQKIRDGKAIPGTPLWMAPEVLTGKEVDEKSDVYSFGIVLWEIITGQEPFPHHDSYQTFKEAITKNHERPPIPPETDPSLKALMEVCWHPDPSRRPSFTQIIPILDSVMIDCIIGDEQGNKFWKNRFLGKDQVAWTDFQKAFAELLKLPQPNPKDLNFICLRRILVTPNKDPDAKDPDCVQLEKFGHVIDWFGPIVLDHKGFSVLDKIRVLMQKDWFHGDVSKEAAEDLLSPQSKGTFLVRTSVTEKSSPFTISKVTKKGKINHQRIQKKPDGKFEITIKYSNGKTATEVSKDDLLVPFIRSLASELYLETACPGGKYKAIFLQTKIEGYKQTSDDD